jgi:hypothetical protein
VQDLPELAVDTTVRFKTVLTTFASYGRVHDLITQFVDTIENEDFLGLFFLAAIVYYVRLRHIRLRSGRIHWPYVFAGLTFVVFITRAFVLGITRNSGAPFENIIRAGLGAGIVASLSGIVLRVGGFLYHYSIGAIIRLIQARRRRHLNEERRRELAEASRLRQIEEERRRQLQAERERREEAEAEIHRVKQAEEQRQREQQRFDCQLLHDQLYPQLRDRFPRKRLAQYFETYMSDGHPLEEVHRRAERLQEMLRECVTPTNDAQKRFSSIEEIRSHFECERNQIQSSSLDSETIESLLTHLNWEEDRAVQEYLT